MVASRNRFPLAPRFGKLLLAANTSHVRRTNQKCQTHSSLYGKPNNLILIFLFGLVLFVHNNNLRLNENRCNETNFPKKRNKSRNPNIQQAKQLVIYRCDQAVEIRSGLPRSSTLSLARDKREDVQPGR